jgi:anaerobic selenocysteine-containing dehydrogenase
MRAAWPERAHQVGLEDAAAIRAEIPRAVPLYAGIERLGARGDQVQWGGTRLFADGVFATADGRARMAPVSLPSRDVPDDAFLVSTRRGKQFNSMVQRERDPLTGADRDAIFIAAEDIARLGASDGERVTLTSGRGTFTGRLHWPEGNALLTGDRVDPDSEEPDYNAVVLVTRNP